MARSKSEAIKAIAIIGAGPSGLATAKYLLAEQSFSRLVIYEHRKTVGGTWNFAPLLPEPDRHNICTSANAQSLRATDVVTLSVPRLNTPMYEQLEANLPHMLMQFSDTPFPKGTQLFPSRECVIRYLEDYSSDIASLIRFEHEILEVRPANSQESSVWNIIAKIHSTNETCQEHFDAVVVANGHCDQPLLPPVQGLDEWAERYPDSLHHSVSYRNTEAFKNKRVLLVRGGPSAADIGQQIARVCQHPLLASRPGKSPYHPDEPNERELPILVRLIPEERIAVFEDGRIERDIDTVFLCTGYDYNFSFLAPVDPALNRAGISALHTYQYTFHMQYPSLAFVETPEMIVPFPLAECQAAVIARVWSGRLALPDHQNMQDWVDKTIREKGAGRGFHTLTPPSDLRYMQEMYEWSHKAEDNGKGKMPRYWDAHACWMRTTAAQMKKTFNRKGEERHAVLGYEELGFHFDGSETIS